MAYIAMSASLAVLFGLLCTCIALTLDQEVTLEIRKSAAEAIETDGEVTILIRGTRKPRNANREALLRAELPGSDLAFSLYANRIHNKVSLESINSEGHVKSLMWNLGPESSGPGTFVLTIDGSKARVHVHCKGHHAHSLPKGHNLLALLNEAKVKLYHEENAPVEIFNSERAALDSIGCFDKIADDMIDDIPTKTIKKREHRMNERMQGDDYMNNYIGGAYGSASQQQPTTERGDIPGIGFETCDDALIKVLRELKMTVEHLRTEIGSQRSEINVLRNKMEECCREIPAPAPPKPRCTQSSCYPGY